MELGRDTQEEAQRDALMEAHDEALAECERRGITMEQFNHEIMEECYRQEQEEMAAEYARQKAAGAHEASEKALLNHEGRWPGEEF
jgi:hypothetical protein